MAPTKEKIKFGSKKNKRGGYPKEEMTQHGRNDFESPFENISNKKEEIGLESLLGGRGMNKLSRG